MANELAAINRASPQIQTDLRKLGGLARASLTAHNHHLVALQGILDQLTLTRDRQFLWKANF